MVDRRAGTLTQPYQHHLHQTAFDVSYELRVWSDSIAHHDVIGAKRVLVEMDRESFGRLADDDRLHACTNRASTEPFVDSVGFDDLQLSLDRATPVATHRRYEERLGAEALQVIDQGFDDVSNVGDSPASHRNRDGLAGFDAVAERQAG